MLDLDDAAAVARELAGELGDLRPEMIRLGRYYDGEHPLPCEPARLTAKHRGLLAESVSNWCALVVDVVAERLSVEGIRASGSPDFDDRAWRWWQCNKMDARSALMHTETLKLGVC